MEIQTFVSGYVDLVQSQDRGRGISFAADYLQPSVDLTALAMLGRREVIASLAANVNTPNTFTPLLTVPDREVWRVQALAGTWSTGIGVSLFNGSVALRVPSANTPLNVIKVTDDISLAASQTGVRVAVQLRDCWLPSGTLIGGFPVGAIANPQLQLTCWYDRLRV